MQYLTNDHYDTKQDLYIVHYNDCVQKQGADVWTSVCLCVSVWWMEHVKLSECKLKCQKKFVLLSNNTKLRVYRQAPLWNGFKVAPHVELILVFLCGSTDPN